MSSAVRLKEVLQAFIEKQEKMLTWEGRSEERAGGEEMLAIEKAMRAVEEKVRAWEGRTEERAEARRAEARREEEMPERER